MKYSFSIVAAFAALLVSVQCSAQSTTPWLLVGKKDGAETGKVGASYMSMNLTAVRVYQKSNWWTGLVEKNRSALATITVSGSLSGGSTFMDKRMSTPITIEKKDSVVDLGFAVPLLRDVPVNFTSLNVEVAIAKTSKDGVDNLIIAANDLSKSVPAMGGIAAASGAITATKVLADFLFNKNLAQEKLHSTSPLTAPAGTTVAPGFYAVLAGSDVKEYSQYTGAPAAGQTGLKWDGAKLTYNGVELKLTYFIVEVAYKNSIFDADTLPNSALSSIKNWARLYRSAQQRINNISADVLVKFNDDLKPIAQMRSDAEQLLNEDSEFVEAERILIQSMIRSNMVKSANARWTDIRTGIANNTIAINAIKPVLFD